ncbi:MAG: bacillithiol biosynthesis cysteine-adding enzyme BshC [Acidobacteriota bacterium]|nr:bacillithiol biosynthesis cysteine-adding enzyme BshC [Acidobacteriota bacterium]
MSHEPVGLLPQEQQQQKSPFKIETISFAELSGQSRLFLDFQSDSSNIARFYPEKRTPPAEFAAKALENYKIDREALCDVLAETNRSFGAGEKTLENINLLRQKDAVAVVTGQQAGLFSGALYTIYKALTAIRLAEDLRKQNIKAVPVFWIAEEDHDFDEVKKTFTIDKNGKLFGLENAPAARVENQPVGAIRLDSTINETIGELLQAQLSTQFSRELKELLTGAYRAGETFSTGFARFIARIFASKGLIIFSPLNKKLKKLSAPVFVEIVRKSEEIGAALLSRTKELEAENYHAQVLVEEDFFPFFLIDEDGKRLALKKTKESNFKAKDAKKAFTLDELIEIAENSPQNLSPNALARPVVQDYLLPTACYFGGAAEIAYFAQNAEIYRILNRPATPIRHRASFTIIEARHARTLDRYNLKFRDLFDGEEKIFAEIVEKFLADGTAREFAEVEEIINTQLNRLDRHLLESEPTLSPNLATRRRKIMYHIGALRKKFHRAEILKDQTARRRIETLFTSLLPHKALQERTLNAAYFLNLYGENFIEWLYAATRAEEKNHQIIYL